MGIVKGPMDNSEKITYDLNAPFVRGLYGVKKDGTITMVSLDHNYTIGHDGSINKQDFTLNQIKSIGSAPNIRNISKSIFKNSKNVDENRIHTWEDWAEQIASGLSQAKRYLFGGVMFVGILYWFLLFLKKKRTGPGALEKLYRKTLGAFFILQNGYYKKYDSENPVAREFKILIDLLRKNSTDFGPYSSNRTYDQTHDQALYDDFWEIYMKGQRLNGTQQFVLYLVWKKRQGMNIDDDIKLMDELIEANQRFGEMHELDYTQWIFYDDINKLFRTREFVVRYEANGLQPYWDYVNRLNGTHTFLGNNKKDNSISHIGNKAAGKLAKKLHINTNSKSLIWKIQNSAVGGPFGWKAAAGIVRNFYRQIDFLMISIPLVLIAANWAFPPVVVFWFGVLGGIGFIAGLIIKIRMAIIKRNLNLSQGKISRFVGLFINGFTISTVVLLMFAPLLGVAMNGNVPESLLLFIRHSLLYLSGIEHVRAR